jgi:hypothetical protein
MLIKGIIGRITSGSRKLQFRDLNGYLRMRAQSQISQPGKRRCPAINLEFGMVITREMANSILARLHPLTSRACQMARS